MNPLLILSKGASSWETYDFQKVGIQNLYIPTFSEIWTFWDEDLYIELSMYTILEKENGVIFDLFSMHSLSLITPISFPFSIHYLSLPFKNLCL